MATSLALDLMNLGSFLGLESGMLIPSPSSLFPEESNRSEDKLAELVVMSEMESATDRTPWSSLSWRSSSSLRGNSRRWAIRSVQLSSISISRSIFIVFVVASRNRQGPVMAAVRRLASWQGGLRPIPTGK